MDASGDRLEIGDVEPEGPQVPVPADDVERVVLVVVGGDPVGGADVDDELAVLIVRRRLGRRVDVPLGVGRVLQQLAVVVAIAPRRFDLRWRLELQDPLL